MRHWQREKGQPQQLELPFAPMACGLSVAPPPPAVVAPPPTPPAPPAPAPAAAAPPSRPTFLRVIQGGGQRTQEPLTSRDAVVRVLVEAGADLLLRRISPERAEVIEHDVEEILDLFDRVDSTPGLMPVLRRKLDALEALMGETRDRRRRPGSAR